MNIKERHRDGQFGWMFDNIHQRINDKVGNNKATLRCESKFRFYNKSEFKNSFSELRKAQKVLSTNNVYTQVSYYPFTL